MNIPDSISFVEPTRGYEVLEIIHPCATAQVASQGAHLLEWTPKGHRPVLYLSPRAVFQSGKAVRGGVPVCWPWFGPHETDSDKPAHGFVRNRLWNLSNATESPDALNITFKLSDNDETRSLWPHAFSATMTMSIGDELHLALKIENTGAELFTMTGALHTYFSVGDISAVRIEGLDGAEYLDTVGTHEVRKQSGDVIFDHEVDRNYDCDGHIVIRDASMKRCITVRGEGSRCAVVWNPWIEKSRRLSDLPDEDYRRFVCVETANAWRDRITLAPGAAHVLATTICVA